MSECLFTLCLLAGKRQKLRKKDEMLFLKGQDTELTSPTNEAELSCRFPLRAMSISNYVVYLFPFVKSERGDFPEKHFISDKWTRKRSEVWLFFFWNSLTHFLFLQLAILFLHISLCSLLKRQRKHLSTGYPYLFQAEANFVFEKTTMNSVSLRHPS